MIELKNLSKQFETLDGSVDALRNIAVRHGPGACMERRGPLSLCPDDPLGERGFPGVRGQLRYL